MNKEEIRKERDGEWIKWIEEQDKAQPDYITPEEADIACLAGREVGMVIPWSVWKNIVTNGIPCN